MEEEDADSLTDEIGDDSSVSKSTVMQKNQNR